MYFSTNSLSSPKLFKPSRLLAEIPAAISASFSTTRMPLPPPPALALIKTGKPMFFICSARNASS